MWMSKTMSTVQTCFLAHPEMEFTTWDNFVEQYSQPKRIKTEFELAKGIVLCVHDDMVKFTKQTLD